MEIQNSLGLEIARKLKEDLSSASFVDTRDSLLQRILSCYGNALLLLRWNESMSTQQPTRTSSPLREGAQDHQQLKHNSKKRKMMPKWTKHIRVKIENDVEGPLEDGYNWRKYGQKDILSAKYPR
ncbi:putative WRKY transcription factor 41 [Glycine max]|nr:putative WRKY transcription factor 41 [Glycine max]